MGSILMGTIVIIEVAGLAVSLNRLGVFDKFKRTKQERPTHFKQEELKCLSH